MPSSGPGDLYLARLMSRPAWARMLYVLFALTALASLWSRVWQGSAGRPLPGYLALAGLYGVIMALLSRRVAARVVWLAFGLLVAASFSGPVLASQPRATGVVQVVSSLVILAGLRAMAGSAVLESVTK